MDRGGGARGRRDRGLILALFRASAPSSGPATRWAFLGRRLVLALPLLLGILTVLFFLLHLAPGDPAALLMSSRRVSPEAMERLRQSWGLDQPLPVQYLRWLVSAVQGDLGYSFGRNAPVGGLILRILPNTLLLSGIALVLSFGIGILVGVVQAVRSSGWIDRALSVGSLFFYSMPSFLLALLMILTFSLFARNVWDWPVWFPASGMSSADAPDLGALDGFLDRLWHLILPVATLTLVLSAGIARYVRASMLEVLGQDYVRTARAKGLPERTVVLKHALRNALLPLVTILGLYLPILFSGTVFVEVVFSWPGMGKLVVDAISQRDYPVVMGGSLVFATMVLAGNLLADTLYALLDPRIRS